APKCSATGIATELLPVPATPITTTLHGVRPGPVAGTASMTVVTRPVPGASGRTPAGRPRTATPRPPPRRAGPPSPRPATPPPRPGWGIRRRARARDPRRPASSIRSSHSSSSYGSELVAAFDLWRRDPEAPDLRAAHRPVHQQALRAGVRQLAGEQ